MSREIDQNTIVTIYEVIMDYVYIWGLQVPITETLSEISKKEKEDGYTSTYHVCIGEPATDRLCSIAMNNIRFDEGAHKPDIQTVADLLTQNGIFEFKVLDESWSLEKSLRASGLIE